jgi:lipoic acid synthetase
VPAPLDETEPERVAHAVKKMGLQYIVITSVTRDDLPDGGASSFAKTIRAIRSQDRKMKIEVLVPDFRGETSSLNMVLDEGPDVLNHNIETVPRLYAEVRPQADYKRSLDLLEKSKDLYPHILTKSGFHAWAGRNRRRGHRFTEGFEKSEM